MKRVLLSLFSEELQRSAFDLDEPEESFNVRVQFINTQIFSAFPPIINHIRRLLVDD
jgi:hypothetical protein